MHDLYEGGELGSEQWYFGPHATTSEHFSGLRPEYIHRVVRDGERFCKIAPIFRVRTGGGAQVGASARLAERRVVRSPGGGGCRLTRVATGSVWCGGGRRLIFRTCLTPTGTGALPSAGQPLPFAGRGTGVVSVTAARDRAAWWRWRPGSVRLGLSCAAGVGAAGRVEPAHCEVRGSVVVGVAGLRGLAAVLRWLSGRS